MWIVRHDGGAVSQHYDEPGTNGIPLGNVWAELPRELDLLVETWDFDHGGIVELPAGRARRIDQGYCADHGPLSIRMAHIQKAIEAQMILAGIDLPHGLVAAEAEALSIDVTELATAIVANQVADHAAEVARRAAKTAI